MSRRLWHRLPWLALGLLGAMASALVVGAFEEELRKQILLAFFVPAVVYMADAVGTQTKTVVIRGDGAGRPDPDRPRARAGDRARDRRLDRLVVFPVRARGLGRDERRRGGRPLAGDQLSVATLVAMPLPYALARLGCDPAFGSGPLATVIQDLLSIMAYFAVAVVLVT